jgi:hypothetical protein
MYDEDKKLLIDDTFMGENTWVDLDRQPVRLTIPFPADRRLPEHQLQLITETGVEDQSMFVSPDNKKLLDVGAFTLFTSVDRWNHHFDSYVAFRFLQNGDRYVEARINAGCTVYFLVDGALKQELVLDAGNNKCSADGDEDYITLSLTESRLVEITVNDSRTGRYELPADPSGKYISGRIWLGAYDATMSFNFIVVTSPR